MAKYSITHYNLETVGGYLLAATSGVANYGLKAGGYYIPVITNTAAFTEEEETVEADSNPGDRLTFSGKLTGRIACSGTCGGDLLNLSGIKNVLYPVLCNETFNTMQFALIPDTNGNYIAAPERGGTLGHAVKLWAENGTRSSSIVPIAPEDVDTSKDLSVPYSNGKYTLTKHGDDKDNTFYTVNLGAPITMSAYGANTARIPLVLLSADSGGGLYTLEITTQNHVINNCSVGYSATPSTRFVPCTKMGVSNTISPYLFLFGDRLSYSGPGEITDGGDSAGLNSDNALSNNESGSRNPYQRDNAIISPIGGKTGNKGGNGTFETGGNSTTATDTAGQTYIYNKDADGNETKTKGAIQGIEAIPSTGGGVYIYKMNAGDVGKVISKMWDPDAADAITKYFAGGAGSAILRMYMCPFEADNSLEKNIYIGGYDTGVSSYSVKQYKLNTPVAEFDWDPFFDSFADYDTHAEIWLPFVGFRELSPDKYTGTHVKIYRSLDFLSGIIVYNIQGKTTATKEDGYERTSDTILDTFTGNMASDIPYSQASMSNALSGTMGALQSGASAAGKALSGLFTGNIAAALGALISGGVGVGTNSMSARRREYTADYTTGGNAALMQSLHIYMLMYRPVQSVAANKAHYTGYNSRAYVDHISNLGDNIYVKMAAVYLGNNIPDDYKSDIVALLQKGVYT